MLVADMSTIDADVHISRLDYMLEDYPNVRRMAYNQWRFPDAECELAKQFITIYALKYLTS